MTETYLNPVHFGAYPESYFEDLDDDQLFRLRNVAANIEGVSYNGLNGEGITMLATRVLARSGDETSSRTLSAIYSQGCNDLFPSLEQSLLEDTEEGVADLQETDLTRAVDAFQLSFGMYRDGHIAGVNRLASSAGYLIERGALNGEIALAQDGEIDLAQTSHFAYDLLHATVVMYQAGLPDSETDVYRAWQNYNTWLTKQVSSDYTQAVEVYGEIMQVRQLLISDGYDKTITDWFSVPTLEAIAGTYKTAKPQNSRIVAMLALGNLLQYRSDNPEYLAMSRKIYKKNKGMGSWIGRDLLIKYSGDTPEGNDIESGLIYELTGLQVMDTHFMMGAIKHFAKITEH